MLPLLQERAARPPSEPHANAARDVKLDLLLRDGLIHSGHPRPGEAAASQDVDGRDRPAMTNAMRGQAPIARSIAFSAS